MTAASVREETLDRLAELHTELRNFRTEADRLFRKYDKALHALLSEVDDGEE